MSGIASVQGATVPVDQTNDRKLTKAAQDFESVLLANLLENMQSAMSNLSGEPEDAAGDDFKGIGVQQIAKSWAESGGVGIARMILPYLGREAKSGAAADLKLPSSLPTIPEPRLEFEKQS